MLLAPAYYNFIDPSARNMYTTPLANQEGSAGRDLWLFYTLPLPTDTNRPAAGSRAEDKKTCFLSSGWGLPLGARGLVPPRPLRSRRTGGEGVCPVDCACWKIRRPAVYKVSIPHIYK